MEITPQLQRVYGVEEGEEERTSNLLSWIQVLYIT